MSDQIKIEQVKKTLSEYKERIELELKRYLKRKTKEAYAVSPFCGEMLDAITDITMRGGKRIRAALIYYSYIAHGGKDLEMAMKASMSIELAQTYLLIHDDIIDQDSLRRGGKTIHKIFEKIASERYKSKVSPAHYGRSVAILAGDTACGLSNEIIAELNVAPELIHRSLLELNKMYNKEYYGQLLDINSELVENVIRSQVIQVHELKTSPYTFDTPLKLGAILAGASEKSAEQLSRYTIPLGVAFQIQDDILGMFGDEKKIGKSVVSDLREGKRTLLVLDALRKANKQQKEVILKNLGNRSVGVKDLEEVKKVVVDTGSLKESRNLAKKFVEKAIKGIEHLKLVKEGQDFLLQIAGYMVNREN